MRSILVPRRRTSTVPAVRNGAETNLPESPRHGTVRYGTLYRFAMDFTSARNTATAPDHYEY